LDGIQAIGNGLEYDQEGAVTQHQSAIDVLLSPHKRRDRGRWNQLCLQNWVGFDTQRRTILDDQVHVGAGRHRSLRLHVGDAIGLTGGVANQDRWAIGQVRDIETHGLKTRVGRIGETHPLLENISLRIVKNRPDIHGHICQDGDKNRGRSRGETTTVSRSGGESVGAGADVRQHYKIGLRVRCFRELVRAQEEFNFGNAAQIKGACQDGEVRRRDKLSTVGRARDVNGWRGGVDYAHPLAALCAVAARVRRLPGARCGEAIPTGNVGQSAHNGDRGATSICCGRRIKAPGRSQLNGLIRAASNRRHGAVCNRNHLAATSAVAT